MRRSARSSQRQLGQSSDERTDSSVEVACRGQCFEHPSDSSSPTMDIMIFTPASSETQMMMSWAPSSVASVYPVAVNAMRWKWIVVLRNEDGKLVIGH